MPDLSKFEGREVVDTKMKITNAGDGLSAAMEIEPVELHLRQTVQVLLECEVSKVAFENATEGDGVIRVPTLRAGRATLVTQGHELHQATVGALNNMTEKLARAGKTKGAIPGQGTLQGDDEDPDLDAADSASDEAWEESPKRRDRPDEDPDDVVIPDDASSLDGELTP